ncbi:immunoglobulin-like domain-containing protein [Haploplasma axanthum]|uniref:Pesticidal crystal protein Cry22Aa Ig-like domain-containing protein n=1 Tax=Haploplasma axanthum TaxID=29552 RepID=A0A449BDB4_HAPAX|nr:immunoglobulin-like domain-containing protein [Haploplasma axanthum]VEU80418.1 Uncharacterised protein [Haploplasma axanthum]
MKNIKMVTKTIFILTLLLVLVACGKKVDNEKPVILGTRDFNVLVGDAKPNYLENITVTDNIDKDLKVSVDDSQVDLTKEGSYDLVYTVKDTAGNETKVIVKVIVNKLVVKLDAPVITIKNGIISWNKIQNATSYNVKINNEVKSVSIEQFDLNGLENKDKLNISVQAVSNNSSFEGSEYSNLVTTNVANNASVIDNEIHIQSNEEILGVIIKFTSDKTIEESMITFSKILPSDWIYDINVKDNEVVIATTGLSKIKVELFHSFIVVEEGTFITLNEVSIDTVTGTKKIK